MTRKLTFLILALFALIAGPGAKVWGQKITTIAGITSGNSYYIGATTSNNDSYFYVDGSSTSASTAGTAVSTKSDATVLKFTAVTGGWTIQFESGNYLGLKNSKDNGKVQVVEDAVVWTIEEDADKGLLKLHPNSTYYLQKNNSGAQFGSYANTQTNVWLEAVGSSKTLVSIAISGNPDKTTYEAGEEFDPAGLVVTGTYTEGDPEVITSGIDWTITPNPLTAGTTSVSVTAKVGEITSAAYQVNGLTVTAALPKITITADKIAEFKSEYAEYTWTANDVSGKCWAYRGGSSGSYNIQFNKTTYVYNTTAVPGRITSVKMTKVAGTTRSWSIYGADEALTGDNYTTAGTQIGSAQEVSNETGTTWNVPNDKNYTYFYITKADGGTNIGEIVITYEEDNTPSIEADVEEIEFEQKELDGTVTDSKVISATGKNLTAPISASMKDGSAAVFSVVANGTPTAAAGEFTVSYSTTEAGEYAGTVVLSSGETSIEIPVSVNVVAHIPVLQSVAVSGTPDKTEYTEGDAFETAGLVVTGTYDVGDPQIITEGIEWTVTPSGALAANVTSVSVVATVDGVASEAFNVDITVVELPKWAKVTANKTDWSGEYLLVYENEGTAYVWTGVDAANCNVNATITDDQIIKPATAVSLTIASMDGGYSILVNGGTNDGKYIYGTSGSNKINFGTTASLNTIAYPYAENNNSVKIVSNTATMRYNNASNNNRFRYFGSAGQQNIQLYEKVLPPTNEAVTFADPEGGSLVIKDDGNPITTGATIQNGTVLDVEFGMTPAEAYKDVAIKVTKTDGGDDVTSTVYDATEKQITMPRYAITVAVTFTKLYKISLVTAGEGTGSATMNGVTTDIYVDGETQIDLVANAVAPNEFTKWSATDNILINDENEAETYAHASGDGTITATFGISELQPLDAPTLSDPTNITYSGVTLNWQELANAVAYNVELLLNDETVASDVIYETSWTPEVTLQANTTYTYTVQGVGDGITYAEDNNPKAQSTVTTADYPAVVLTLSENGIARNILGKLNTPIDLPITSTQTCDGKVFMGWSATTIDGETDAKPSLLGETYTFTNPEQPTATIYAVYAKETPGEAQTVFSENFDACTGTGGNDDQWSGSIAGATLPTFTGWIFTKGYAASQCAKFGTSSAAGSAKTPAIEFTGKATLTFRAGAWSGDAKTLNITTTSGTATPASVTLTDAAFTSYEIVITGATENPQITFAAAQASKNRFFLDDVVVKTAGAPTYSNYCTTTPIVISGNIAWNNDVTISGNTVTIENGAVLKVNGVLTNSDPENLIIEDGAQLIQNSSNVMATVQKNITGYTDPEGNDGYYLIANPTDNATVAHLTENNYDLYTFNPAQALEWHYEKGSNTLTSGIGYLYANSATTTLQFAGALNPAGSTVIELTYADAGTGIDFPGFNLIGNPYTCKVYLNKDAYVLNGDDFVSIDAGTAIAPCQGFFVEATQVDKIVTLSTTAPGTVPNALNIAVSQNRGNVIDRAIVNFNGSNNLHKFMMNPAHTNLSIAKGSETFAAISTEAEGELPVNFKAEKNGTYTITVNTKNVDAEYLHLIDNMTGMDVDLLATPSYTFNAKTSDYASRFKLVFGVKNEASESSDSNFAFMSNGNLVIDNIEGEATLQIVDELGRVISTETVSGSYNKALNLKAGLYIINLNGMTQKIVVK